jgi:hypothetical protein
MDKFSSADITLISDTSDDALEEHSLIESESIFEDLEEGVVTVARVVLLRLVLPTGTCISELLVYLVTNDLPDSKVYCLPAVIFFAAHYGTVSMSAYYG